MSIPSLSADPRRYFVLRLVLLVAIFAPLVLANRQYFFQEAAYENGDQAANTLSVLRSEAWQELHGQYSRWGFRHPGPAVFYGEGWAELVLYRWLHVVPAPYNAQTLLVVFLMTSILAAGLSVAARWVRSRTFLFLAAMMAVLHFAGANLITILLSNWPAYVIPMPLFALLVATASVAAGEGRDLPLVAFAGCLLLHMHVAQPLFVGPMFILAYAGLAWSLRRRVMDPENASPTSTAPWHVYRRAHGWALLIAGLFALPLLIDLCQGPDSNFFLILEHLRNHHGERHSLSSSLDYFLRFAVYQPSLPNAPILLKSAATPHDVLDFVARHPKMMLLWLAALLSPLLPLGARRWLPGSPSPSGARGSSAGPAAYETPDGRWRFLGWLWLVWVVSVGLTLLWGCIQDGDMFYFNAWFNYAIWYVLALLAAASLTDALDVCLARVLRPSVWRVAVAVLCGLLAVVVIRRPGTRYLLGVDEPIRLQVQKVQAQLAKELPATPRGKLLIFPDNELPTALAIAVVLTRAGNPVYVLPYWKFIFGQDHVLRDWETYAGQTDKTREAFEVWRLVPTELVPASSLATSVPLGSSVLVPGGLSVDPVAGFAIRCQGKAPNSLGYVGKGWTPPGDGGSYSDEKTAWLQLRPQPVPDHTNVTMTFDFTAYLPSREHGSQRIKLYFNGVALGTLLATDTSGLPNQFVVPGGLWNQNPSALIVMEFPDAISPKESVGEPDERPLGFLIRSLTFSTVPADTSSR